MSTFQTATVSKEVAAPVEKSSAWNREDVISANVLAALGRPARLLKVAVRPVWGDKFRVNVWTGESAIADAIPNSYFVTADGAGAILRAEPPIQKLY